MVNDSDSWWAVGLDTQNIRARIGPITIPYRAAMRTLRIGFGFYELLL